MGLAQCGHVVGPLGTAMPLQPAPGVSPESPLREGQEAHRVQLPEPVLVAVAQVASAPVPTGVLDAGVDGHGAVFALRRGGNSAGLGRLSMAFQWPIPEDGAGQMAPRRPRDQSAVWPGGSQRGPWE